MKRAISKPFRLIVSDPSEDEIHESVAKLLDIALPKDSWWTTIEHRNAKNAREGAMRKARGVKKGIPDIVITYNGIAHWIEIKNRTGSLSKEQIEVRARIIASGANWALCRSVDDVMKKLNNWEIPINARISA